MEYLYSTTQTLLFGLCGVKRTEFFWISTRPPSSTLPSPDDRGSPSMCLLCSEIYERDHTYIGHSKALSLGYILWSLYVYMPCSVLWLTMGNWPAPASMRMSGPPTVPASIAFTLCLCRMFIEVDKVVIFVFLSIDLSWSVNVYVFGIFYFSVSLDSRRWNIKLVLSFFKLISWNVTF